MERAGLPLAFRRAGCLNAFHNIHRADYIEQKSAGIFRLFA